MKFLHQKNVSKKGVWPACYAKESYSMAIQIKLPIQHWILYVVVILKMDFVVFREIWLENRSYNFYFLLDYLSKLPADSGDLKNTSGM